MLPTFKQLTADYSAKELNKRLADVAKDLSTEIPDGMTMVGMGSGDLSARYKTLIQDIKKRADHKGIHGFRHDLKLHGGDIAQEVMLFAVEQAVLLSELNPDVHGKVETLMGGDPADPESASLLMQGENAVAKGMIEGAAKAARLGLEKMLSDKPPDPPPGQPSAKDLMFYSGSTYQYLDKALWHTGRARKARRILEAYKASRVGKDGKPKPLNTCSEAAIYTFLLQTYFHHYHKAKVYASPMMPLVEFINHWVTEWRTGWLGTGPDDKNAMRNMMEVYETISTLRVTHKKWDCTKDGGVCYGPGDDPKTQSKPFKEMGYTDGTAKFTPATQAVSDAIKDWFAEKSAKARKGLSAAWDGMGAAWDAAGKGGKTFYQETLQPLFDDESIFEEPDARDKTPSARDVESVEEVIRDTKLQFERFSLWVMSNAPSYDWRGDETFLKRKMRRMVAADHSDEKHAVQVPWDKLFGRDKDEGRHARMMYDVYSLVEAKDLTKNVSNAWKKFWAPKKKGEIAVTLLFVAGGIVASVFTGGLPIIAVIGIAAAKKLTTKASLKGVKKLNAKLNKDALKKKGDLDPNTEMVLTATEARESAASLARHFVSSFKNYQRMVAMKKKMMDAHAKLTDKDDKRFLYPGCTPAVSYAYAAHAFDHHFTKTMAKVSHLTAMTKSVLATLEEGDDYFVSEEFAAARKEIHDLVLKPFDWHKEHCDGIPPNVGKPRIGASRASPTYVSQNLPSPICYASRTTALPMAVQRGLFFMDYFKAESFHQVDPPYDMLEHWVNARDVMLADLKKKLGPILEAEKAKNAIAGTSKEDNAAILDHVAPGDAKISA